jgi:hypothetical protein
MHADRAFCRFTARTRGKANEERDEIEDVLVANPLWSMEN